MKKLVLIIIVLAAAAAGFLMSEIFVNGDEEGTIDIVLIDKDGNTVKDITVTFDDEDTLLALLQEYFDVECADMSYNPTTCDNHPILGNVILTLDDVETDWTNTYIAIYVDDEYSTFGVDNIPLDDRTEYRFEHSIVEGAFE